MSNGKLKSIAVISVVIAALLCIAALVVTLSAKENARPSSAINVSQSASSSVASSSSASSAAETAAEEKTEEEAAKKKAEEEAAAEKKAEEEAAAKKAAEEEANNKAILAQNREERMKVFDQILAGYQEVDRTRDLNNLPESPLGINLEAVGPGAASGNLVYTYYDIANDGSEELLIARHNGQDDMILYELIGFDEGSNEPKRPCSFTGYRSYCTILKDGLLMVTGSGGANTGSCEILQLEKNSAQTKLVEKIEWDFEGDFNNVKHWYTDSSGNKVECAPEKKDEISKKYQAIETFDWKPVADFTPGAYSSDDTDSAAADPSDAPATEESEPSDEYTITEAYFFTMEVPEYWRGKVTWDVETMSDGNTRIVFYPANIRSDPRPDFPIATVWVQDMGSQLNMGDYLSHVAGYVEGTNKRVCVSTQNYAGIRAEFFYSNPNYGGSSQEDELYNALYDLQLGGNMPMSPREAARQASNPGIASSHFAGLDVEFVKSNVLPLIRDVA